jgi:hypothetical protein
MLRVVATRATRMPVSPVAWLGGEAGGGGGGGEVVFAVDGGGGFGMRTHAEGGPSFMPFELA